MLNKCKILNALESINSRVDASYFLLKMINTLGYYRLRVTDYFDSLCNQIDLYTEEKIARESEYEPWTSGLNTNRSKQLSTLATDRERCLNELSRLFERERLSELEITDQQLFQPFYFVLDHQDFVYLIQLDQYLSNDQVGRYKCFMKYLQIEQVVEATSCKHLLDNIVFKDIVSFKMNLIELDNDVILFFKTAKKSTSAIYLNPNKLDPKSYSLVSKHPVVRTTCTELLRLSGELNFQDFVFESIHPSAAFLFGPELVKQIRFKFFGGCLQEDERPVSVSQIYKTVRCFNDGHHKICLRVLDQELVNDLSEHDVQSSKLNVISLKVLHDSSAPISRNFFLRSVDPHRLNKLTLSVKDHSFESDDHQPLSCLVGLKEFTLHIDTQEFWIYHMPHEDNILTKLSNLSLESVKLLDKTSEIGTSISIHSSTFLNYNQLKKLTVNLPYLTLTDLDFIAPVQATLTFLDLMCKRLRKPTSLVDFKLAKLNLSLSESKQADRIDANISSLKSLTLVHEIQHIISKPLPSELEELHLQHVGLVKSLDSMDSVVHLKTLSCENVNLSELSSKMIEYLSSHASSLEHLFLLHTHITLAEGFSFRTMKHLTEVRLNCNKLEHISPETFQGLDNLKLLEIINANTSLIEGNSFECLSKLEYLEISHNKIKRIDEDTFAGLFLLKQLKLNFNQTETVDSNSFGHLTRLETLQLSGNRFNHGLCIDFSALNSLESLMLAECHLSSLSLDSFDCVFNSLKFLSLCSNEFSQLPDLMFRNLSRLNSLHIRNNRKKELKIGPLAFKNLVCLVQLSLSGSMINISRETFKPLHNNLIELELTHTEQLSYLYSINVFSDFNCLLKLELNHNSTIL